MSDTKPIAAVEPEDVHLPFTPSVKGRFKVVAQCEIDRIRARVTDEVNRIEADALAEIRQWEQMVAHVEQAVPAPAIRAGRDPYTAPEWAQNTDTHLERMGALHDAQDAREGARR